VQQLSHAFAPPHPGRTVVPVEPKLDAWVRASQSGFGIEPVVWLVSVGGVVAEVHLVCEGMTSVLQDMHPHGLRRSAPVERRGQPPDTHHLQELCGRAAVSDRDDNGRLLLSPAGRVQMILSTMFARTHVGRPHSLSIAPFPIRLGHWLRSPRRRLIGRHRSPVSVVDEVAQEFTGATPWRGLSVNTHSYPARHGDALRAAVAARDRAISNLCSQCRFLLHFRECVQWNFSGMPTAAGGLNLYFVLHV
jgi:hypothetical protein